MARELLLEAQRPFSRAIARAGEATRQAPVRAIKTFGAAMETWLAQRDGRQHPRRCASIIDRDILPVFRIGC
jgi:hypothetical protein